MTSYVTFPGTAGNYISTPDINLLDADTAHGVQSIGGWTTSFSSTGQNFRVIPDLASPFGDSSIGFDTGPGVTMAATADFLHDLEIAEYTLIFSLKTDLVGITAVQFRINAGTKLPCPGIPDANGYTEFSVTWSQLTQLVAAECRITVEGAGFTEGITTQIAAACLREGSDPTFVPSLNIVGDLDIEAKVAADDWTTATDRIIADNYDGAGGYRLSLDTSDNVALAAFGTTGAIAETTAAFTFVDGDATIIRAVLDVSAGTMDWLQDGVSVDATDTFTAQPLVGSDIGLFVGSLDSDADHFDGDIYYVEIRDGEDGPVVARMDAADAAGAT